MARNNYIHDGLVEWGGFVRDNLGELLYPSQSAEQGMAGGRGGSVDPDMPSGVAMMETAVLMLDDDYRVAVTIAYTHRGTREDQARCLSRKLDRNISHGKLKTMIDCAHHELVGIFKGLGCRKKVVDTASR